MARLKRLCSGSTGGGTAAVQPWDRHFLMAAARSGEEAEALASLPAYLELERVVEGLSDLLRRSMGVQLQERALAEGEGWAPGVRKLAAVHDTGGVPAFAWAWRGRGRACRAARSGCLGLCGHLPHITCTAIY